MEKALKTDEISVEVKQNKIQRCIAKVQKWAISVGISIYGMVAAVVPVSAAKSDTITINDGLTTEQMIGGIINFICNVARYMGFVVIAAGIFMFVFAYKDDNAESQSRAARFAVIGAILLSLKTILKWTGLIE